MSYRPTTSPSLSRLSLLFQFSHSFLSPLHLPHSNISYPSIYQPIYPSIRHPSIHSSSIHTPPQTRIKKDTRGIHAHLTLSFCKLRTWFCCIPRVASCPREEDEKLHCTAPAPEGRHPRHSARLRSGSARCYQITPFDKAG